MSNFDCDINNIMEYLTRKGNDMNDAYKIKCVEMPTNYTSPCDSFLTDDVWGSNTDDLLDILSLDNEPLNLLDASVPDFLSEVPGSACSDSGMSSDHADVDLFDQASPFLLPSCDEQVFSPQSGTPSLTESSPTSGDSSHSSMSTLGTFPISPEAVMQDFLEEQVESDNQVMVQSENVQTFQNPTARKRKQVTPVVSSMVIQPKIQRHYISKNTINLNTSNVIKPRVVVSAAQKPLKMTNIQVINPQHPVTLKNGDNKTPQRKVIRVAPMAGNPRSILLPVTIKNMKELRSIKIINATDLRNSPNIKLAAANLLSQTKHAELKQEVKPMNIIDFDSDSNNVVIDESNSEEEEDASEWQESQTPLAAGEQYPRLQLSPEERRLLSKEGVRLPARYPLTKMEERELKRIRRKIRNKISAQDSRKRKKEYVDGLEDRVKQCTEENQTLMKRIKILQSQNQSLAAQLKRLQNVVTRGTSKTAQPATCLLVLLLSVALVALPSLRTPDDTPTATDAETAGAVRRALLQAPVLDTKVEEVTLDDDYGFEEVVAFTSMPPDHDYQAVGRWGTAALPPGYLDVPLDEEWPPNLKREPRYSFDLDDGHDYLPPVVKDDNYQIYPPPDIKPDIETLNIPTLMPYTRNKIITLDGKIANSFDFSMPPAPPTEGVVNNTGNAKPRTLVLNTGSI